MSNSAQVHPDPEARSQLKEQLEVEDLAYPDRRVQSVASETGATTIRTVPRLLEWAEDTGECVHGFENGIECGGHWNANGHRIAGELLAETICADLSGSDGGPVGEGRAVGCWIRCGLWESRLGISYNRLMANPKKLEVRCTCCEATLTVDAETGDVLFAKQPQKKNLSFEDALTQVKKHQDTASDRFDQAFEKEKGRKDLIDRKFREAMERADELDTPVRDIDLD